MKQFLIFFLTVSFFTAFALAQDAAPDELPASEHSDAPAAEPTVQWFQPQLRSQSKNGISQVTLGGRTTPGSSLSISQKEIPVIRPEGKFLRLLRERAFSSGQVLTDDRGIFEMQLSLPQGTAQIPIQVTSPGGEIRNYQISVAVEKLEVNIKGGAKAEKSPYAPKRWEIWGGLGINYLQYSQSSADLSSDLTLKSFDFPTLYGKVSHRINDKFSFTATANQAPGKSEGSTNVNVGQGSYNWSYLTGEFTYFHPRLKSRSKNYHSEVGFNFGAQYHIVPFIARSSTTDPAEVSIETNGIWLNAIGVTWLVHLNRYYSVETFMRYQVPFATGSLFHVVYKFAFDGSLGLIYKWTPEWNFGLFWYGQYHSYEFSSHRDKYFAANGGGGPDISGEQSLLYSNLEFRVGWTFD